MQTIETLIAAAEAKAAAIVTFTREDGSTFQGARNYASAEDGDFQVYVVHVTRRSSARREHYRATFYVKRDGKFQRVSRSEFSRLFAGRG